MVAKRVTVGDFDDIRRLHLQPEVMMTLSVDDETLPDEATHEGIEVAPFVKVPEGKIIRAKGEPVEILRRYDGFQDAQILCHRSFPQE